IEIRVLKGLQSQKKLPLEAKDLAANMGLEYAVLMTAVYELQNQGFATFIEQEVDEYQLTEEGRKYVQTGLPERIIINYLLSNQLKECPLNELQKKVNLEQNLYFIGMGNLKKLRWIQTSKATGEEAIFLSVQEAPPIPLEKLLTTMNETGGIAVNQLEKMDFSTGDRVRDVDASKIVEVIRKRKIAKQVKYTRRLVNLTEKGKKLDLNKVIAKTEVTRLTPDLLQSGEWKNVTLKSFNVAARGPALFGGKLHPVTLLINKVREVFLSMGFTEIRGPMVESAFYNFDALFQPQDHPAREMHDTFYLDNPKTAKLPPEEYIRAVAQTHETGGSTGSIGWGGKWSESIARQMILRTHTTATTIRRLSEIGRNKEPLPARVFSIDRVFRNEKVDFKHLAEFTQIEGIVIDKGVTLSDLRGLLTSFFTRMGFSKVLTRPGYYPYTEPSLTVSVYSEDHQRWFEMAGSGIFRPEVTEPWGIKDPDRVLAWGMGFERLAMLYFERKDIRDLYRNPLSWLREVPV
ncbi:MAG: phenylalanyl-tRNA synthetase alpha subunit, partial [Promethearchaeota archaeon CR_4]